MTEPEGTPLEWRLRAELTAMAATHEEFLRAVAHDLRAPLRHFMAYGKLAGETLADLPPDVAQGAEVQEVLGFLATMEQSARRMGRMIDGLQALSRASRAPLRLRPVPLADVLAQARAVLGESAVAANTMTWHIAPDLPTLQADPALLQELLQELLGNAIKFTQHTVQPQIAVQAVQADMGRVAFTVADNGAGFDPARAGQLFGVFQRLHRELEFDGVGAGLVLCRAIAQRHGGAIHATAQPGAGCTVRVEWPR